MPRRKTPLALNNLDFRWLNAKKGIFSTLLCTLRVNHCAFLVFAVNECLASLSNQGRFGPWPNQVIGRSNLKIYIIEYLELRKCSFAQVWRVYCYFHVVHFIFSALNFKINWISGSSCILEDSVAWLTLISIISFFVRTSSIHSCCVIFLVPHQYGTQVSAERRIGQKILHEEWLNWSSILWNNRRCYSCHHYFG